MLDARTRRAGSHHQKLVVIRHPDRPDQDVAFVGGIDLGLSRRDDHDHAGDPQVMDFPVGVRPTTAWHDIQAEVRGPAVHDLEHTFRERWYGSSVLDIPSPLRQLYDRAYHASAMTGLPLPEPQPDDPTPRGSNAVQVLRTYPARLRRYPFAPHGERSIAHAYRRAFARARRLVYLEDQYLWSRDVATVIAAALRANPRLHVVVVVPRYPDHEGRFAEAPARVGRRGRRPAVQRRRRGPVRDLRPREPRRHAGVRARQGRRRRRRLGDDRLGQPQPPLVDPRQRAVRRRARRARTMPASRSTRPAWATARGRFARDLRLQLWREHLDRQDPATPATCSTLSRHSPRSPRPRRRCRTGTTAVRPARGHRVGSCRNTTGELSRANRLWANPVYRLLYDPDGRRLAGPASPSYLTATAAAAALRTVVGRGVASA